MNFETLLLGAAIVILLALIIYSILPTKHVSIPKTAESQAESLKNMLDEYAQKVQEDQVPVEEKVETPEVTIPTKQYPKYDNSRAVDEMGLTQEEADSFVLDLIKAVGSEVPRMEEAIQNSEYKTLEEIVHTVTGSSSTLGSGGISSAFISFYAAVQHHDTMQQLSIHLQNVKYYLEQLKEDSKVSE